MQLNWGKVFNGDEKYFDVSSEEKTVLRELAFKVADIATKPEMQKRREMWYSHNGLKRVKPLLLVFPENSWGELIPGSVLKTKSTFSRRMEWDLLSRLYSYEHFHDDKPVEARMGVDLFIDDKGYGIQADRTYTEIKNGSAHFEPVIKTIDDIDKIRMYDLTVDWENSNKEYEAVKDIFGDILHVFQTGMNSFWFAMMDYFITYRGIENMFLDMYDNPEWLHAVMEKMTQICMDKLDQAEKMGILSPTDKDCYVGSGGLAYSRELPEGEDLLGKIGLKDMWGHATTQIFTSVSPEMHEEFALQYERKILSRFGLNCYGCCEPVENKMEYISKIPNLRRISMSPWVDMEKGAKELEDRYIFSNKPNPEVFARETFDMDEIKRDMESRMEITRDCVVEFIVKDTHTVRGDVSRLTRWTDMSQELAEKYI